MRIQFSSLHGQAEVDVPDFALRFKDNEIKEVSDEVGAALLTNPNFVEIPAAPSYGDAYGGN
jgi:hypothetical protein